MTESTSCTRDVARQAAQDAAARLRAAHTVFWDFDGVIKESVSIKADAFEALFLPYGAAVAARVREHHLAHGGVSRFEKVPLYLGWAGMAVDAGTVQLACERFAGLVRKGVIDAPWVAGVPEYLEAHHSRQRFVLVTATPQEEIEEILQALRIGHWFEEVHGAPVSKAGAVGDVLRRWKCARAHALMVGDSATDLGAAVANGVAFLLRRTPANSSLWDRHSGAWFESLSPSGSE